MPAPRVSPMVKLTKIFYKNRAKPHRLLRGIIMRVVGTEPELRHRMIGRFLKDRREKARLTQWDVARRLGYTTAQFISNWERGISLPPCAAIPRIAELYKLQTSEVIDVFDRFHAQLLRLHRKHLREAFHTKSVGR